ncbi:uncharacterized protein YhaN [Roseiarcus fermentans]|uniref:Uncharacterized protein YhaN n=1 Tax=Roseiarcus fermentans TaxID=1473586 RepID=A0A366EQ61_9HYPH|nr:AAA family ATPase [Roseiarcus fermentans]RBP04552.1 uncharacterized protein YhaN [Roseiarcus fermentans]
MRIERLDLVRYGRFSDYPIDFGARPERGPDFHVIYGLNEAGKSTVAAAILDLLFGIEDRSAYGAAKGKASVPNWHAYNSMRIGARLDLNGTAVEVARLKRDRASLVDKDNLAFDEAVLRAELGGVDREAFRMMFSLDDESLEKGGEAILESKGDLGRLLFSASAGLSEMSGRLDRLRDQAEKFYKPRGKITELAEKKRALDSLREERDRLDTAASAYADLLARRDEAKAAHDAAVRTLGARRSRAEAIRRLLAALPRLAALAEAERRLAPLAGLPTPPPGWPEALGRLQAEAIRLVARRESADTAVKGLEAELERIGDDPEAVALLPRVEGWRSLRSRWDTARDIPVRRNELTARQAVVADILRRLGREGEAAPKALLLPARTVGALEDLIAARSGVESKRASARGTLEAAKAALAEAVEAAPPAEAGSARTEMLERRLAAARRDASGARLAAAREELESAGRKVVAAMAALKPWSGHPEALAEAAVPSAAEAAGLRTREAEIRARRRAAADAFAQKSAEVLRLEAEAAAAGAGDLVGDAAASDLRAARDDAWRRHRGALSADTADAFEGAMRRDDAASAARLAHARELASLRERAVILAGVRVDRARAQADVEAAEKDETALAHEIAGLMPAAAPAGRDALGFLDAWRTKRDEALALVLHAQAAKETVRRVADDAERARKALGEGLAAAGVAHDADAGMAALIDSAEAAVAAAARAEALHAKVRERRAEVLRAESRLATAEEDDARWRRAWRDACAESWLAEGPAPPTVGAMRQTLKALEELRAGLKDCADLEHRIAAMARDRAAFADEVAAVGEALGFPPDEDASRLADAVVARATAAQDARRRRTERAEALVAARTTLDEIGAALAVNRRLEQEMTSFFGVATLPDVAAKLDDCKRREALREELANESRAIVASGVAGSFDAARAALEAADRTSLEQELADCDARAPQEEAAHAERFAALTEAERALAAVGGDDAVARIEEKRRTILEEIKDGARRYLALRAGVAAADQALKLYRDRHRGAMMERASQAFCEISRGAYRGLSTQPEGQSETLIALGADGGSKSAGQLSKGARFQLYLALRVAGFHELARSRRPAPFVADDIMETFDDFRAEEALKLFADMGTVGQVIYLTHHGRLAEIAQKICPTARLHELKA